MWCDLWWPQCFQLLDFLSPCLQHRPLKARAAILCSAACIHTQGHQDKKKKKKRWRGDKREGEGPVWPRSSQVSPFVHSQNTAGSPPPPLSALVACFIVHFPPRFSLFLLQVFPTRSSCLGNHNKTAALLLFKRLLYWTKDRKWNSRALTRRQIFAGRHDGAHTKDRLMSWQALLSWHNEGRWYQAACITI